GSHAVALLMIVVVTATNIRGTRQSADVQGIATIVKVGVILLLAVALASQGSAVVSSREWWPDRFSIPAIARGITAMIGVLWAYEGWQSVTFSAGEPLDPQRVFARGIVGGTAALIGIYVFANVGYFRALGVAGVASSSRVASDAVRVVLGATAAK